MILKIASGIYFCFPLFLKKCFTKFDAFFWLYAQIMNIFALISNFVQHCYCSQASHNKWPPKMQRLSSCLWQSNHRGLFWEEIWTNVEDNNLFEVKMCVDCSISLLKVICICCGSILSLAWILFSFVSNSLSYITIPKNNVKIKFKPRIELKIYPELIKVHTANMHRGRSDHVSNGFLQEIENNGKS